MKTRGWVWLALAAVVLSVQARARAPHDIDNTALSDEQDGTDWPAFGRTFNEGHYSPLNQVNTNSIGRLGLAWSLDLEVTNSITAPLEVNGVVYLGAGHGIVHAIDARTGKLLWRYDAKAMEVNGKKLRVAWGIRGLAFWKDRVYS